MKLNILGRSKVKSSRTENLSRENYLSMMNSYYQKWITLLIWAVTIPTTLHTTMHGHLMIQDSHLALLTIPTTLPLLIIHLLLELQARPSHSRQAPRKTSTSALIRMCFRSLKEAGRVAMGEKVIRKQTRSSLMTITHLPMVQRTPKLPLRHQSKSSKGKTLSKSRESPPLMTSMPGLIDTHQTLTQRNMLVTQWQKRGLLQNTGIALLSCMEVPMEQHRLLSNGTGTLSESGGPRVVNTTADTAIPRLKTRVTGSSQARAPDTAHTTTLRVLLTKLRYSMDILESFMLIRGADP